MNCQDKGLSSVATVAAILHTYNEELQIARCLDALRWVDEILLVDTFSTDRTVEITRAYTDRILQRAYVNAATTKNWALEHAPECDWLLFVDADEVVSNLLAEEIRQAISETVCDGYEINVLTYLGGKPSRSTYWNPNYQVRLFRRGLGRWEDREVHAHFQLEGNSRRLQHPILHFPYPDLATYLTKLNRYTSFEARQMLREARPLRDLRFPVRSILRSILQFYRLYVRRRGYRDGAYGFVISLLGAMYPFLADAKYWEMAAGPVAEQGSDGD